MSIEGTEGSGYAFNMLKTITETNTCFICCFCKSSTVDDLNLGQLFMYDGVVVHYFCMLFSAALSQHGKDDEGILGFLPNDIMAEVRRSFRLKCSFCNIAGASVGCCNKRCRTAFHFPCGLKNGANFQFFGNYESFCAEHVVRQKIHIATKDWICPICTSQVMERKDGIMSSCCGSAVFHKECLQKLALSSGYFFKCPMCNNGKEFVHEMRCRGIFVPEQDASWEREPNAFEDLYYQHSKCDATECVCPKGKDYSAQKGSWVLARCRICGASGTHKKCSNLSTTENWACEPCTLVEQRTDKDKEEKKPEKVAETASGDDPNEDAYVSARSGNRKVRNGRLHKRKANTSYWKLSDVMISPSCFWFFPYDKPRLAQFASHSTLPDWRKLTLKVNLVNWIPKSLFSGAKIASSNLPKEDPHEYRLSTTNRTMLKTMGVNEEDSALISDSEIIVHYKATKMVTTKSRRRNLGFKASKWGRGVIKRNGKKEKEKKKTETRTKIKVKANTPSEAQNVMNAGDIASPTSRWDILSPERVLTGVAVPMELCVDEMDSTAETGIEESQPGPSSISSASTVSTDIVKSPSAASIGPDLIAVTERNEVPSPLSSSLCNGTGKAKEADNLKNIISGSTNTPLGTKNELNVLSNGRSVLNGTDTNGVLLNNTESNGPVSLDSKSLSASTVGKQESNENCNGVNSTKNFELPCQNGANTSPPFLPSFKLRSPKDLSSATVTAVNPTSPSNLGDRDSSIEQNITNEAPFPVIPESNDAPSHCTS